MNKSSAHRQWTLRLGVFLAISLLSSGLIAGDTFERTEPNRENPAAITVQMQDQGAMGDVYHNYCLDPAQQPFYSPTLQERAWTSPIWINPSSTKKESS